MCAGSGGASVASFTIHETHMQSIDNEVKTYIHTREIANCQVQCFRMFIKLDLTDVLDLLDKHFYCLLNLSVREK